VLNNDLIFFYSNFQESFTFDEKKNVPFESNSKGKYQKNKIYVRNHKEEKENGVGYSFIIFICCKIMSPTKYNVVLSPKGQLYVMHVTL
jgi:hypothetical protein